MLTNSPILYIIRQQMPAVLGEVWRWWEPRLPSPSTIVEKTAIPPPLLTGGFISTQNVVKATLQTIPIYNVINLPLCVLLLQLQNRYNMMTIAKWGFNG
jgi:hypothetical protein